jgi:hypothetical protein
LTSTNTLPTTSPPAKDTILEYFRKKVPSEGTKRTERTERTERDKRIQYLVQATQGFWKAQLQIVLVKRQKWPTTIHQNVSVLEYIMLHGTFHLLLV